MKNSRGLNRSIARKLDRYAAQGLHPGHRDKDHRAELVPNIRVGLGGRCNIPQEAGCE